MQLIKTLRATATATAMVLIPAAASATGPYEISVGSTTSGPVPYTATTSGAVAFSTPLLDMSCTSAAASGEINTGTNASGVNAASVLPAWSGCRGPLNLPLTFTASGTWRIDVIGDAQGTQLPIELTNITFVVHQTSAPANCTFTVTGSMSGHFDESAQQLVLDETGFTGDLTLSNKIGGCYGSLFANGHPIDYAGTLDLNTQGAGLISIDSSS